MAAIVISCAGDSGTATTSPSETTVTAANFTAPVDDGNDGNQSVTVDRPQPNEQLAGFRVIEIELNGEQLWVAVADIPHLQQRGLMNVTDLGELDGMLFVFSEAEPRAFWMKDTLMALDIGYFGADGALDEILRMEPCSEDPCPTYPSREPAVWALEMEAGSMQRFPIGSTLFIP